jgi:serine/threonine protein kinase
VRCAGCQESAPIGSRFCPACGRPILNTSDITISADDVTRLTASDGRTTGEAPDTPRYGAGEMLADRYRIVRLLGRGGMGEVYLVHDVRLDHQVALKFLPPALAADSRRLAQFHNEVRLARRVSHPNVCRVYDIGEVTGGLFLSMEYVEGEDLAAALRRVGSYPEQDAVELTRQICAGLGAAHDQGVLHRDLKPANIMINRAGRAQVMDFGLAVAGQADHVAEGTPAYMAPEQLLGKEVTVRSDLYALGLVMYELFTGQRAFDADTPLDELVALRSSASIAAPTTIVRTLNAELGRAILACLDPDPSKRPASAHAVSGMLQTVLLDARTVSRRVAQLGLVCVGGILLSSSVGFIRARGLSHIELLLPMAGAIVFIVGYLRFQLRWQVTYKGHVVMFQIHPIRGERLYIDGALVDPWPARRAYHSARYDRVRTGRWRTHYGEV